MRLQCKIRFPYCEIHHPVSLHLLFTRFLCPQFMQSFCACLPSKTLFECSNHRSFDSPRTKSTDDNLLISMCTPHPPLSRCVEQASCKSMRHSTQHGALYSAQPLSAPHLLPNPESRLETSEAKRNHRAAPSGRVCVECLAVLYAPAPPPPSMTDALRRSIGCINWLR